MLVQKIIVKNFRNLAEQEISLLPELNVFCGKNGMGKTNLLESVYFASIGRSPRTRKDTECLAFGKNSAEINLEYLRADCLRKTTVILSNKVDKKVVLDGMPSNRISDIVGNFGSVYFSPDETQIVRGSPSFRRKYIDIINCQISKEYMKNLSRYQHAILQRNNYLKKQHPSKYTTELECWDTEISRSCALLIKRRATFLQVVSEVAGELHKTLSDNKEYISVNYESILENTNERSLNEISDAYMSGVKDNFDKDSVLGYSTFGAHNDDYSINLFYVENEQKINLRKSGSLGQQRTATLALKLAEVQILEREYGEAPVLLLDDVLGELDEIRREKLMNFCKNYQTIITCTEWDNDIKANKFLVENGVIKNIN